VLNYCQRIHAELPALLVGALLAFWGPVREGGCLLLTMDSDSDMDLDSSEQVQQSGYFVPPLGSSSLPLSRDVVFPSAGGESFLERELARRMNDPTKLHTAANTGDFVTLRRLLAAGLSPDHRSESGLTPLQRVCWGPTNTGDPEACFRLLRDAGANLEATTNGLAPLHYAAGNRDRSSLVAMLIEAGVNVNVSTSMGTTPLHRASKAGSETAVAMLVKAGAAVDAKEDWNRTPLHFAVDSIHRRHHRAIPVLLRAGAEIFFPAPEDMENPTENPYIRRVLMAGGFRRYEQNHLAKLTRTFASKFRLPAQPARRVAEFWLHAGYY
jgi:hypothetical protein